MSFEGKLRAVADRASGQRTQRLGDRLVGQQWVAPVVQVDLLREQLGAQTVAGAQDRVTRRRSLIGQLQSSLWSGEVSGTGRNGS